MVNWSRLRLNNLSSELVWVFANFSEVWKEVDGSNLGLALFYEVLHNKLVLALVM